MIHHFTDKLSSNTIVMLHGTGGDETSLINLASAIDPEANLLGIRGNINEGGMNRYFKRFGIGSYDLESYVGEVTNLKEAIETFSKQYNFDLDKVLVLGFSNGANIGLGLIQEYPNFLKKYAILSADYINKDKGFKDLENTDILISSSKNDPYLDFANIEKLVENFKSANANVLLEMVPGHNITMELVQAIIKWNKN